VASASKFGPECTERGSSRRGVEVTEGSENERVGAETNSGHACRLVESSLARGECQIGSGVGDGDRLELEEAVRRAVTGSSEREGSACCRKSTTDDTDDTVAARIGGVAGSCSPTPLKMTS